MKNKLLCLAVITAVLCAGAARGQNAPMSNNKGGQVHVTFDHPEQYADVKTSATGATDPQALDAVRDFLVRSAAPRIPEGSTLTIVFKDLDLAGGYVETRKTRQMRSTFPPRAEFTWTLTDANGTAVRQGKESLSGTGYLTRKNLAGEPLFYDKDLLGVWVNRTFR